MKAISLYQPHASLVGIGAKHFETRSWSTKYRGLLAIHATQRCTAVQWNLCKTEPINTALRRGGYTPGRFSWRGCLPLGCIVALVDLVDVLRIGDGIDPKGVSWEERAFGDWTPGRYAWQLENVRSLNGSRPLYCPGRQGLWTVGSDLEAEILGWVA